MITPLPTQSATEAPLVELAASAGACAPSKQICSEAGCLFAAKSDLRESASALGAACASGSTHACTSLGVRMWFGDAVPKDVAKAAAAFQRSCQKNDALACVDEGKAKSIEDLDFWAKLCGAGIGEACLEAGDKIRFGAAASTHSPGEGAQFYERGCNAGVAFACARLAYHAGTGLAMTRDDARMFTLFEKSCACGSDVGCSGVAFGYRDGRGAARDFGRAKSLFESLCRRNVESACVHLGYMLEVGQGGPPESDRAKALYRHACDDANRDTEGSQGCYMLGQMFRDGRGVTQDDKSAYDLFDQACQLQQSSACRELGRWNRDGRYVAPNKVRALELLDQACNHGESEACTDAQTLRTTP